MALAAALPLALTACGGEDSAGGGSGEVGGTITYWSSWQQDEPQAKVLLTAIEDFEKSTGATVEVEWQGREVTQKLAPLLRSGDMPDLVDQTIESLSATLGTTEQGMDLADVYGMEIPGEGTSVGDAGVAQYQQVSTVSEAAIVVPYQVLSYGLWFDAATHPELAEQPPASQQEFESYLAEQKAEGEAPIAIDGDYGFARGLWIFTSLLRQLGPDEVNALAADETGARWDDPRVRTAINWISGLAGKGYFLDGSFGTKWPAQQERFAGGEGDVFYMGSWFPQEVAATAGEDFEFSSFQVPAGPTGDMTVQSSVIGFAVPKAADNAATAKAFTAWFLKKEYQSRLAKEAKVIPTRADVQAPPELRSMAEALKNNEVTLVFDGISVDYPQYLDEVMWPPSLELMAGKINTDQFLQQVKSAQVEYWQKNR